MARVKYGGIVTDISGSVSGATFQRGIYGGTMRNKPNPIKSATPAQMLIRGYMMQLHYAWSDLDPADRTQWDRFISFSSASINRDKSILLSGHDLFLKYNLFRLLQDQEILTVPSYSPNPEYSNLHEIENDYGVLTFKLLAAIVGGIQFFNLKLSAPRKESLSFSKQGLRFIFCDTMGVVAYNITAAYLAVFGALPAVGAILHYSIRFYSLTAPVYSNSLTGITTIQAP